MKMKETGQRGDTSLAIPPQHTHTHTHTLLDPPMTSVKLQSELTDGLRIS